MKKDNRDCSVPYPIYPPYQGMVPPMGMPGPMPIMNYQTSVPVNYSSSTNSINNIDQQLNNIEQEINNLDRRISNLENMYNKSNFSNNYSSSNYQMM